MKYLAIFVLLTVLCSVVRAQITSEDTLRTSLSIGQPSLSIGANFSVSNQISQLNLAGSKAISGIEYTIKSEVASGPMLVLSGTSLILQLDVNLNDSTGQGLINFSGRQMTIISGFYTGPPFSSENYLFMMSNTQVSGTFTGSSQDTLITSSDTEITIGGSDSTTIFYGVKILEVTNTNPLIRISFLRSTFQPLPDQDSNGVQIIINNTATVIGTNDSYPTFVDLEYIQFSGGTSNIDYGNFTGIQRESVYGQIRATDSSEVTISEDHENRSFLYVDFNAVGGQLIFEGGNLSRDISRKFFILASESGIITIENNISGPKFTNIESIICNDKSFLNIFTVFTYSPEDPSQALIQTYNSTVVIGRASQQNNFTFKRIVNMSSGELNVVSGNIVGTDPNIALITTSDTYIIIGEGSTANFTASKVFDITKGVLDIQGGTFTGSNVFDITKGILNIQGGTFTGSQQGAIITSQDTNITIGGGSTPIFIGVKILEVLNTDAQTKITFLRSTFQQLPDQNQYGVQMIINNAATVIGTNDSYPTFVDLEFLQFGGGTSNIDYGNFTGIQRGSVYGQIKATNSSKVTISENHENRSFLYVDFNAVGGQLIFEGGNLSKDINRKFFILASESGIITIENTISNVSFTNIDQIICNDHSTLNIFTSFTYSPEDPLKALIQTFDSTVVIGRASLIDELNIEDRWILNMSSGELNIVSGNIKANSTDQALITTYGTFITIVKRATAIFTTSNVFNISEGIMNIQGGTFIQNSTELAMITATNATVTFGENSTSIFKAAWGLDVIQGNLNIFEGIFTYKSIKHGMVKATDAMATIGRNQKPTMTGFNLFDILR
ncbi:MAG: hypothetical protein EZS28_002774, partial [Streblomastix strix]